MDPGDNMKKRQAKKIAKKGLLNWFWTRALDHRASRKPHYCQYDFIKIPIKWWKWRKKIVKYVKQYYPNMAKDLYPGK